MQLTPCDVSSFSDDYLIMITSRRRIIRILDTDVYLATDFKVYPIRPPSSNLGDKLSTHKADETFLLSLVKGHLYSGPFYYTYGGIDLTSRMQKQDLSNTQPMWKRVGSLRSYPCVPEIELNSLSFVTRPMIASSGTSICRTDL